MYKKCIGKSSFETKLHNSTWREYCERTNIPFQDANGIKYIGAKKGKVMGLLELVPSTSETSLCEHFFAFREHEKIKPHLDSAYEVGKLFIAEDNRGKGAFVHLLVCIYMFCKEVKPKVLYGGMRKSLCMSLKEKGFDIEIIGKDITDPSWDIGDDAVVPVFVDVDHNIRRFETELGWFSRFALRAKALVG